jgi:DNA-binding NtrC family response regulator
MDSTSTVDEDDLGFSGGSPATAALALVVVWCADAPWRVGEIGWLPRGFPGESRLLGRDEALADDPHPRLTFVRQRPSGVEAVGPFSLPRVSRVQLVASAVGLEHVRVENVGRRALFVGGKQVDEASVAPGRTLQLGHQLLLLCVRRPVGLPALKEGYPIGPFGGADGLGIVGESPAIWKLRQELLVVGGRSGHALLLGASGSGKELSARGVHALSDRSGKSLVARNAATIPESIVDAEVFGNAKGYPNPGMLERPGLVGEAHDSTLFLDEIAELPFAVQAHFLRVLDSGEYHRLGESVARRSNLRLVAATNRPLARLKDDLLARFSFRIEVPDLNVRREDVPLLARHVLARLAQTDTQIARAFGASGSVQQGLSIGLCRQLVEHDYSTHLRELERMLLQSFVQGGGSIIDALPPLHGSLAAAHAPATLPEVVRLEGLSVSLPGEPSPPSVTPARIQAVLDEHNGNLEVAYRALGLKNRFALGRLIAKHGIEVRRKRAVRPRTKTKRDE